MSSIITQVFAGYQSTECIPVSQELHSVSLQNCEWENKRKDSYLIILEKGISPLMKKKKATYFRGGK